MYFANPYYFFLSVFIAFVILLYFFRKQYTAVTNPSNLLWQQVMNEWNASPWLKKLQQNLLFWLQIMALTLLILTLAGPIFQTKGLKGEQQIWIVDTSASMSAIKDQKTLLDLSKEQMMGMVQRLQGQEVTIIKAGEKPSILLNREKNTQSVKKIVNRLSVTYEHENVQKAVRLAESFVSNEDAAIHIFSDGVKKEDISNIREYQYVEVHNSGGEMDNISLLSFGVNQRDSKVSGLAVIENQGRKQRDVPFIVKSEETVLFEKTITIPAGKQIVVDIPSLPVHRYYQAVINVEDHYSVDNEMTSVYTEMNPNVYGLGEINPFLIKAMQTLGIQTIQLDQKSSKVDKDSGIVLAEGISVEKLPNRPIFYINKGNNSTDLIELKEPIKVIDSSLTEYVDMEQTYIKTAAKPIQGNWKTIVMSGNYPLIQTGKLNGQPAIIVNFPIENTDWPLHTGFPIFLFNSYQWLSKQTGFLGYFQPGEEKWLQFDHNQETIEIYNQSGKSLSTFDLKKENFKAPYHPGVYQAVSGGQIYYFSVLLDDREKKLSYEPSFVLQYGKAAEQEYIQKSNESFSFWLILAVLLLLMGEWEVYRRGFRA